MQVPKPKAHITKSYKLTIASFKCKGMGVTAVGDSTKQAYHNWQYRLNCIYNMNHPKIDFPMTIEKYKGI